ncbi:MAG: response regulator transcription factor [Acidimicrobiales bacterium]
MADEARERRRRVLLVDDHARARQALRELLEELDPQLCIELAADGTAAVRRCAEEPPDLVLLDYRIPGATAAETLARLHGADADLPVVVLTGDPTADVVDEVIAAGALACLGKAGNVEDLLDVIRSHARHRS